MFYVTGTGRVVNKKEYIGNEDYIEVLYFPKIPQINGKIGWIKGINKEKNEIVFEYEDSPVESLDYQNPVELILSRIETALNRTQNEIREEGAAIAIAAILPMGAAMTFALADAGMDVPAVAGTFAEEWQNWTADGETAAAKSLWKYNGIGYQARTAIQKIENYAPDKAPNNYAVRPIPDVLGVFPTVMNMDVSVGMKLRGEDGKVYECYANPITSLQWQPSQVPASFRLIEG